MPDETITHVAVKMTAKTSRRPFLNPPPSPANARCTAIITNDDADARHFISRRVRSASAFSRARVCVCADGAKKVFLTYTGWHRTVQKFI